MSIADLKFRGIILIPTDTIDDTGGSVRVWTETDEIWCGITAKGDYHQITVRQNSNLKAGYRIIIGELIFEILQVVDAGNLRHLKCRLC
jgi:head-tail adaptor